MCFFLFPHCFQFDLLSLEFIFSTQKMGEHIERWQQKIITFFRLLKRYCKSFHFFQKGNHRYPNDYVTPLRWWCIPMGNWTTHGFFCITSNRWSQKRKTRDLKWNCRIYNLMWNQRTSVGWRRQIKPEMTDKAKSICDILINKHYNKSYNRNKHFWNKRFEHIP